VESCLFVFAFMTTIAVLSHLSILDWFVSLCGKVALLFWEVLCTPTRIARFLGEASHLPHLH
jgi:hypothetical protein